MLENILIYIKICLIISDRDLFSECKFLLSNSGKVSNHKLYMKNASAMKVRGLICLFT